MNAKVKEAETAGSMILWFDIIREARRGRTTLVRVLYILVLFVTLLIPYYATQAEEHGRNRRGEPPIKTPLEQSLNYRARLATNFTVTILVTQWLAVLVLMPIYAVSSLHADRDNCTLELLLTTPVTGSEIILDKLFACSANVSGVLLGGIPLIAIAQIWGGVDIELVFYYLVMNLTMLFAIGSLSFHYALRSNRSIQAIGQTYAVLMLGHAIILGMSMLPCVSLNSNSNLPSSLFFMVPLVLCMPYVVAFLFFQWKSGKTIEQNRSDMPTLRVPEPVKPMNASQQASSKPDIHENALIWKEKFVNRRLLTFVPVVFLVAFGLMVSPFILGFILQQGGKMDRSDDFDREASVTCLAFAFLAIAMAAVSICLRLAGCIASERQRQTLDSLLTIPWTRGEILRAKILGNLVIDRLWFVAVAIAWATMCLFAPFSIRATVSFATVVMAQLLFFGALGLFLSVVSRTVAHAQVTLAVIAIGLFTIPIAIPFVAGVEPGRWVAFHPLALLFILGQCWWENDAARGAEFLWPQAIYLLMGAGLALEAWRRFERRA